MKATQFLMLLDSILMLNNFVAAVNSSNTRSVGLRHVYDCACPGHNAIYECTVSGTGATIWRGEAFDCPDITLYFTNTNSTVAERECNNGAITGRLIHAQSEEGFYTSQLTVNVSSATNGTNIECLYDSGATVTEIGSSVLTITEGPFPKLNQSDIRLVEMDPKQLIFEWSDSSYNCPFFHYCIMASNCGQCPNTTRNTTVTCTGNFTQPANCLFSVKTVLCDEIVRHSTISTTLSFNKTRLSTIRNESDIETLSNTAFNQDDLKENTLSIVIIISGSIIGTLCIVIVLITTAFVITLVLAIRSNRALRKQLNVLKGKLTQQPAIYEEIPQRRESLKSSTPSIETGENTAYATVFLSSVTCNKVCK